MNLIFNQYTQPNNLIINFSNDKLDQSKLLIKCLKNRDQDSSENLQLEGDHLTPVISGLRQNIFGEDYFGLLIPETLKNVDSNVLNPQNMWSNKDAYVQVAKKLSDMFKENFKQYGAEVEYLEEYGPVY